MSDNIRKAVEDAATKILPYLESPVQGHTLGHLVVVVFGFEKGRVDGLPYSRIIDRALQKLRKQNKIRFVNRQWELVR